MKNSFIKWSSFVVGNILCLVGGLFYVFGLYAADLKVALGYGQATINILGAFTYSGSGLMSYWTTRFFFTYGARKAQLLLGTMLIGSLALIYFTIDGKLPASPVLVGIYFAVLGAGKGGLWLSSVFTNTANFTVGTKGKHKAYMEAFVSAFMTATFGLGGTVFTVIYRYFYEDKPIDQFFLFQLFVVIGTAVIGFAFLDNQSLKPPPDDVHDSVALLINSVAKQPPRPKLHALKDMLTSSLFWAPFLILFLGTSIGGTYMTNLGTLVIALGGNRSDIEFLVITFSISQTGGRMLTMFITSRPSIGGDLLRIPFLLLALNMILTLTSFVCFFVHINMNAIYVATVLIAVGYGSIWVLFVSLIRYFPIREQDDQETALGVGLLMMAPAISGVIVGEVSGIMYEKIASVGPNCIGADCYRSTFLMFTILGGISSLLSLFLRFKKARDATV